MGPAADRGLSPARVERQLAHSLERLGVEQVELFLAHEFDPEVALGESLARFEALQNSFSLLQRDDQEQVLPLWRGARGHLSGLPPAGRGPAGRQVPAR